MVITIYNFGPSFHRIGSYISFPSQYTGGSHVPFCPPSPVKGKKGQDKKGQKGTKGDKKGQNGHKNTKYGKNDKQI